VFISAKDQSIGHNVKKNREYYSMKWYSMLSWITSLGSEMKTDMKNEERL
jgi:hypothetical protein